MDPYNWPGNEPSNTIADVTTRWNQIASAVASIGVGWYRENLKWDKILLEGKITSPDGTSSYSGYLSMNEAQINPIIDSFAFADTQGSNPFHVDTDNLKLQDIMVNTLTNNGICFVGMLAPGVSRDLPFCDGTQCSTGNKVSPSRLGPDNYLGLVYLFSRAMVRRYSSNPGWDVRYWQIENEINIPLLYEIARWRELDDWWGGLNLPLTSVMATLKWAASFLFLDNLMAVLAHAVRAESSHIGKQLWVVHNYAAGYPKDYLTFIGAQYVDIIGVDVYNGKLNIPGLPSDVIVEGKSVSEAVNGAKFWGKPVWVMEAGYSTNSLFFGISMPESEQRDYDYYAALSASGTANAFFLFSPTSPEGASYGSFPPDENGFGVIKPTKDSQGAYSGPRNTPAWDYYQQAIACRSAIPPTCSASGQAIQVDSHWPTVGEVPDAYIANTSSPEWWSISGTHNVVDTWTQWVHSLLDHDSNGDHELQLSVLGDLSASMTDIELILTSGQKISGASAIHVDARFGLTCSGGASSDVGSFVQIYDETAGAVARGWSSANQWGLQDCNQDYEWKTISGDVLLNSQHQYSVRLRAWDSGGRSDMVSLTMGFWEYVHISVNDFGVSASHANDPNYSYPVTQCAGVSWGVTYTSIGNFQSPITLSSWWESPAPAGVTVTFSPPTANPTPGSDPNSYNNLIVVTVWASASTATGSYRVHVKGTTSYGLSHDVWFNVNAQYVSSCGGGGGGSIMAGTQVLLSNGSYITVQNIGAGLMSIRSFDPVANSFFNATVDIVLVKHVNNLYVIGTDKGNPIRVDYFERFWVQLPSGQRQWKLAGELQTGDQILRPVEGVWATVTFINVAQGNFTVYDLIITPALTDPPGAMPVIANGYLDMKVP